MSCTNCRQNPMQIINAIACPRKKGLNYLIYYILQSARRICKKKKLPCPNSLSNNRKEATTSTLIPDNLIELYASARGRAETNLCSWMLSSMRTLIGQKKNLQLSVGWPVWVRVKCISGAGTRNVKNMELKKQRRWGRLSIRWTKPMLLVDRK